MSSNEQMITDLGFDLTCPRMSQPGPVSVHKANSMVGELQTVEINGGFDLRWPLLSQPEQPTATMKDTQKRAA
jgi:hypothetical protein